ncbi:MAG TPA: hypothetical protein VFE77_07945 [Rhodanobacter sp.]|nr:hypothetical protein [Rhodanobacter sp.]
MSVLKHLARVRMAQARMATVRRQVGEPASALIARGRAYPLAAVGIAAGTGFALGSVDVRLSRVPGMTSLLSGGIAAVMTQGSQWLAELAALGMAAHRTVADTTTPETPDDPAS